MDPRLTIYAVGTTARFGCVSIGPGDAAGPLAPDRPPITIHRGKASTKEAITGTDCSSPGAAVLAPERDGTEQDGKTRS